MLHSLAVGARAAGRSGPEHLQRLLTELLADGFDRTPACVLAGHIVTPSALAIGNAVASRDGRQVAVHTRVANRDFDLEVRYVGRHPARVIAAVATALVEPADVCVWFEAGDRRHRIEAQAESADLAAFALRAPYPLSHEGYVEVRADGGELRLSSTPSNEAVVRYRTDETEFPVRCFVMLEGQSAWMLAPAFLDLFAQHFGADHLLAYAAS